MSMMLCDHCDELVDTDADPESLYTDGEGDCYCEFCRLDMNLGSEFDEDRL